MDPVKRAAMFIRMNDLLIQNVVVIPVVWRNGVGAATARLRGMAHSGGTRRSGISPTGTRHEGR